MIKVGFLPSHGRRHFYRLTQFKTQTTLRLHQNRATHVNVYLHWLREERRSIPCGLDTCEYCKLSRRPVSYAPALEYDYQGKRWVPVIAVVNESCLWVMNEDLANIVWRAKRRGNKYNGPVQFDPLEAVEAGVLKPWDAHDILPTLYSVWGVQIKGMDGPAAS